MNDADIAKILLQRANESCLKLVDGQTRAKLGNEGFSRALAAGWLVVDESGVYVSTSSGIVAKMREVAQSTPIKEEAKRTVIIGRPFFEMHSKANSPNKADSAMESESEEIDVGDSVLIGDAGQQYDAVVQARKPDGRYVLSFGPKKPAAAKNDYDGTEVRLKMKAFKKPASSVPAAPSNTTIPFVSSPAS